ncbi:MAG TPA: hypothetical protein VK530_10340, partial [Candidatus Acidoferrum sp.]|nr:hypothetical protein [Candidatus Acidoferrum sp.]
ISDWAVMHSGSDVLLNWYGPSSITTRLPSGLNLKLRQRTEYPRENRVRLQVAPDRAARFTLKLRVPHWSEQTRVIVNGKPVDDVRPGRYLALDRTWKNGDIVDIEFDFALRYWAGEREYAGKTSIFRGPLLLAYDRRFNDMDPDAIPPLDAAGLTGNDAPPPDWFAPMFLQEFAGTSGRIIRLCDFASAGVGGSPYRSWLEVRNVRPAEFSKSNPLRAARGK